MKTSDVVRECVLIFGTLSVTITHTHRHTHRQTHTHTRTHTHTHTHTVQCPDRCYTHGGPVYGSPESDGILGYRMCSLTIECVLLI